jgi:hypothetical protein
VHCSRARTSLSSSALVVPRGSLSITTSVISSRNTALAQGARAVLLEVLLYYWAPSVQLLYIPLKAVARGRYVTWWLSRFLVLSVSSRRLRDFVSALLRGRTHPAERTRRVGASVTIHRTHVRGHSPFATPSCLSAIQYNNILSCIMLCVR